mmetsp:Transcript_62461/g.145383  ORF Transcript_62461/g.145383 Transcript_62461/m.145383 type:complete len:290 (+) Transcript_62461:44-913(+)|eukprot:CAMPEP_0171102478 /NCGR_PEP_ID=MMETSP0766_2-20121228/57947_1 /TAXON_ID=439317 /ORGANISM="Gambierdiscus australes, Strain CAWD 149" /LENGTH=289 /DNA_ID=CAMNT_0011562785 /DNA_START=43 /DNA_END=912 /DNA_ORIENTATION=+
MGNCFAVIGPDQIGTLEFLGKFHRVLLPGFHCLMPGSVVRKASTRIEENKVKIETKTKDNVFVNIKISVQTELFKEKAYEAVYKLSSPEAQIDSYVADIVRGHVPSMTLDTLFESKQEIAMEVQNRLTKAMQAFGFHIRQVLVVDVDPDTKVKEAMNKINESRRLRMAAEEKAEADKVIMVKKAEAEKAYMVMQAEAEAESKQLQGQGVAKARQAIINGMKESICNAIGEDATLSSSEVQELLLVSQYLDTLEKLSQGASTTVFMPHSLTSLAQVQEHIKKGLLEAAKA